MTLPPPARKTRARAAPVRWRAAPPRGVTILEVLISIFILLIGIVSILAVFPAALRLSVTNREITTAARAAESAVEELVASQAFAFPSGVADSLHGDDDKGIDPAPISFNSGDDHEYPYYCLWDGNIPWRDQVDMLDDRISMQGVDSYIIVKKNSPGDAERRLFYNIEADKSNGTCFVQIYRSTDNNGKPRINPPLASNNEYMDKVRDWIWPVRGGARYWLGNFREDREAGRFPAYARISEIKQDGDLYNTLVCEVVQEGTSDDAGDWDLADWDTDAWRGFALIHTGDHQETMETEDGAVGVRPTEQASAQAAVYLITGNTANEITCARADFLADRFQKGDFVRIAGNAAGRVWWPEGFLNPGSYLASNETAAENGPFRTIPVDVGSDYSYACVISGWEQALPNLYRIDLFVYRNFNPRLPPEQNRPIKRFGTMLAGR